MHALRAKVVQDNGQHPKLPANCSRPEKQDWGSRAALPYEVMLSAARVVVKEDCSAV